MRKIRNAAVVGLAAFSLMAGTISAASAAENDAPKKDDMSASVTTSSEKKDDKADMGKDKKDDEGSSKSLSSDKDDKDAAKGDKKSEDMKNYDTPAEKRPAGNNDAPTCKKVDGDLKTTNEGDPASCTTNNLVDDIENTNNSSNSSVWGHRYAGDRDVTGRNLLGFEKNFSEQPVWAQIWYVATILGVIGSVIGVVALPVLNQAKAQGLIV